MLAGRQWGEVSLLPHRIDMFHPRPKDNEMRLESSLSVPSECNAAVRSNSFTISQNCGSSQQHAPIYRFRVLYLHFYKIFTFPQNMAVVSCLKNK